MLDLSVAYNRYSFLGNEFLTWLWHLIETDQDSINKTESECLSLEIGNRIVLENRKTNSFERVTIKGDEAGLEEARLALSKGAFVAELSLIFKTSELQWRFSVKGESLNVSNLKTPGPALPQNAEELESFLLTKVEYYNKILNLLDKLFKIFIKRRLSPKWNSQTAPTISKWIQNNKLR